MSSLSGQTIQSTYQGLLKLSNSTTGVTSNLQAVEDGLGNDTGLRLSTNQLESHNINSIIPLKAQYYGVGMGTAAANAYASGTQNIILCAPFYDNANYSYSAISINTTQITSTSDSVEYAIYTTQLINPFGIYPHTPIISGMTADTTSTGTKTFTFPSNISMSGYGAGIYWIVWKISNSGVQPTWRPGQAAGLQFGTTIIPQSYGLSSGFTTIKLRPKQ